NTLRSTHSTYPSVHAVGLAEPCAKTNRRRPPQPALCPKAPAALKPAAKIAKTHPPQTQICHGISAREKCRLVGNRRALQSGRSALTRPRIKTCALIVDALDVIALGNLFKEIRVVSSEPIGTLIGHSEMLAGLRVADDRLTEKDVRKARRRFFCLIRPLPRGIEDLLLPHLALLNLGVHRRHYELRVAVVILIDLGNRGGIVRHHLRRR